MGSEPVFLRADYVVYFDRRAQALSQNFSQQLRHTADECDGPVIVYIGLRWFFKNESDVAFLPDGWCKTRHQNVVVHGQERSTGDRASMFQHRISYIIQAFRLNYI